MDVSVRIYRGIVMKEQVYRAKKKVIKTYKKYFSFDETYTNIIPDSIYLKKLYRKRENAELDLRNPKSLNEKLQWLKLNNRKHKYTVMADKYLAREFIKMELTQNGFKENLDFYFPKLIGVWNQVDEIDFGTLPEKFVLKCNHDNGVVFCRDKERFNVDEAKSFLEFHINLPYYKKNREWPYKDITRRIICEELLEPSDGTEFVDYKFYAYGGEIRYFMYSLGEKTNHCRNHKFDINGNSIDYLFKDNPTVDLSEVNLPSNLNLMVKMANVLCEDEPHVRIDMYNIDGRIYMGEITFYSGGGFINIQNKEYSDKLASYIDIELIKNGK